MEVKSVNFFAYAHDRADFLEAGQQTSQRNWDPQNYLRACRSQDFGKTSKLDGVAEPLFRIEQYSLTHEGFACPFWPRQAYRYPSGLFPAPFVFLPTGRKIAK